MCIQGPSRSIRHPSRLKEYVRYGETDGMIVIEPLMLSIGVFIGRARPCHVQLEELESLTPVAAIRYDRDYKWSLTGLASSVRVNGHFVDGRSVQLSIGDRVQIPPYELIVSDPDGAIPQVSTREEEIEEPLLVTEELAFGDTTFELRMPNN